MGEATELAVAVVRRDAADPHHPPPPTQLRPILRFHGRLAPRARITVRDVLDTDPAFRERVAAEIDEASVERSTWLFLARPDGWEEELALLADAVADETARADAARQEQAAARRVEHLEAALERARANAEDIRAALESERERRRRAEGDVAAARDELATRDAERSVTLRHLAEARRQAADRQARIHELERDAATPASARASDDTAPAAPAAAPPGPWDDADPDAVGAALRRAADTAAELQRTLDEARRAMGPGSPPPDASTGAGAAATAAAAVKRTRRVPVRLTRGALEGDADGVDQLLRSPGVVVLVDGYNVSMAGWPDVDAVTQRDRLVTLLSDAASRTGADVRVVFDGDDDGRRPAVSVPLAVRVHFTPGGVEADDVILDMVGRLPADRPVTVVSSDRRVQDGARPRGANVVPSEALLRWARR